MIIGSTPGDCHEDREALTVRLDATLKAFTHSLVDYDQMCGDMPLSVGVFLHSSACSTECLLSDLAEDAASMAHPHESPN